MALAEEIAHYKVGVTPSLPFYNDYFNMLIRSKNEFKAFKWLANEIIPKDKLKWFLKQNMNTYFFFFFPHGHCLTHLYNLYNFLLTY